MGLNVWEAGIVYFIQEHLRFDFLTPIMQFITTLGNGGMIAIAACVLLLIFKKTRIIGLTASLSLAIEYILTNLFLKVVIARTRPFVVNDAIEVITKLPGDFSFPSGHSGACFAVASVMCMLMPKKYGIPAIIIATLIALSRLYVGVHYPTDVLGGILIGCLTGFMANLIVKKLCKKKENTL